MEPSARRLMSIHEAGHAIVAMALGQDIVELRITEEGGHSIKLKPHPFRSWHSCSSLGGVLACAIHCRHLPEYDEWNSWENCHEDWRLFEENRGGMSYRQGRRLTLQILRDREDDLMKLASILERDGFVDSSNAQEFYGA